MRDSHALGDPQPVGHAQQIDHLMAGGKQGHVALAGRDGLEICLQRGQVFGKIPAIYANRLDPSPTGFQPRDQARIGLAIFLQAHGLLGHRQPAVDRGQHFAPGVRFRHAESRLQAQFLEYRDRLGPAGDGGQVRHGSQETAAVDVPFDLGQQVPNAHAGHEDDDVDLAGNHPIGEIDGLAIFGDRHFAHRGTNVRQAPRALDQPGHFRRTATLESRHAQAGESAVAVGSIAHETSFHILEGQRRRVYVTGKSVELGSGGSKSVTRRTVDLGSGT